MWKHYLKTAWRNIKRNKTFSIINIFGLSIGLACSMLIVLYVKDENSFDRFHKNRDHIYRVISKMNARGDVKVTSNTGLFQGPKFAQNVPGVKGFIRYQAFSVDVKNGSEVHSENVDRVDSNFFSVFTFPLIAGNATTCLKDPYSLVLSEDAAIKQFGTVDAIGKVVMIKDDSAFVPYRVSAVAKNCPQNSSIRFDALSAIRVTDAEKSNTENWFNSFLNTFVVLEDNADLHDVEKRMQAYFVKDAATTFNSLLKKYGMSENDVSLPTYRLQAYTDMHLDRDISSGNGIRQTSSPVYSYILSAIALFILLIACINFINLTVARSVKRAKEIGIRKVVGGGRKQLIKQFLGESLLFCFIAFGIALLLTYLMLPLFNRLSNKSLSFSYLIDAKLIVTYVLLFIVTGLLAGFYPAIVLSRF
ncbi:MAG TPA: ABC transporter permease, partial [Arachidicoccus sp.]|nr:ABC transporter permease [Arachidicoccus sp.]